MMKIKRNSAVYDHVVSIFAEELEECIVQTDFQSLIVTRDLNSLFETRNNNEGKW